MGGRGRGRGRESEGQWVWQAVFEEKGERIFFFMNIIIIRIAIVEPYI